MIQENVRKCASGYLALVVLPALTIALVYAFVLAINAENAIAIISTIVLFLVVLICYAGFFMVAPNQSKVLQLFGTYVGSVRETGLRWANPFYSKETVSLRVRNFESEMLKVNDSSG
ncbi:MAG: SPFH domain-containing protein, partial [Pseudomonadota bacterium]